MWRSIEPGQFFIPFAVGIQSRVEDEWLNESPAFTVTILVQPCKKWQGSISTNIYSAPFINLGNGDTTLNNLMWTSVSQNTYLLSLFFLALQCSQSLPLSNSAKKEFSFLTAFCKVAPLNRNVVTYTATKSLTTTFQPKSHLVEKKALPTYSYHNFLSCYTTFT